MAYVQDTALTAGGDLIQTALSDQAVEALVVAGSVASGSASSASD
jgi:hypothetical protein